ncbi:MAG: hypothetical protein JWN96_3453 [Mycobacterium sp.]|nr:hypothetical protein [Mycobacterium sp.]
MANEEPYAVMRRVGKGIALREQGQLEAARNLLAEVWTAIGGPAGDPFYRVAVAHSMADTQTDVEQELVWDLHALDAADQLSEERAARGGITGTVAGFQPSLQLNVADCYRRLGKPDLARHHLDQGNAALGALGDDGYATMIRGALQRLAQRLSSENSARA